jgi:hypothetical protein
MSFPFSIPACFPILAKNTKQKPDYAPKERERKTMSSSLIFGIGHSANFFLIAHLLFSVGDLWKATAFASTATLPKLLGTTEVDYSAASEFIDEHYHIPGYFGNEGEGTVRAEPIFDARHGVVKENGEVVTPCGAMKGCGFCLIEAPSKVENFDSLSDVSTTYLEEMRRLIPQALDVDKDEIERIIFWHPMLRGESITPRHRSDSKPAVATAASMVHIDTDVGAYGLSGILDLVGNNLIGTDSTTEAPSIFDKDQIYEQLATENRRFLFLNTWRPLAPVRSRPLAIWATNYKEMNGMFPVMRPCLDTSRWYVFPEMEPSECLIFKQYDRRRDQACDFWHTSLDMKSKSDGDSPQAPRRSFDMKAMVIMKESVSPDQDRLSASTRPGLTLEESGDFCEEQANRRSLK